MTTAGQESRKKLTFPKETLRVGKSGFQGFSERTTNRTGTEGRNRHQKLGIQGKHPDARGWWLGLLKGRGDLKNLNPGSE